MPETTEQRIAWIEKANKLVTKEEFKAEKDITRREFRASMSGVKVRFRALELKINSLEKALIAQIIMVDDRITSMRWIIGIGVAIMIGAQDNIQALVKNIFGF